MKKDIRNRADIEKLVQQFYASVQQDALLAPIFNEVAKVNWDKHLPVMYDFWENVLFYTGHYSGNPLEAHQKLHQQFPLEARHFERWNQLFLQTVDSLFEGRQAELAKQRALSISTVMRSKIQ